MTSKERRIAFKVDILSNTRVAGRSNLPVPSFITTREHPERFRRDQDERS